MIENTNIFYYLILFKFNLEFSNILNTKISLHVFSVVQNRITAYWFRNKELAMAFGITLAFSRLGSVLNFFMTQIFEDAYGLTWTLWAGI